MAPLLKFVENADYVPATYVAPRGVLQMHDYPRWGWSSDPVYLDSESSQDEKQDYLRGITIGSLIVFMVFIVWALILLFLKCAGRKRVGCASGMPKKPQRPQPQPTASPTRNDDGDVGKQNLKPEQGQEQGQEQEQAAVNRNGEGPTSDKSLRDSTSFGREQSVGGGSVQHSLGQSLRESLNSDPSTSSLIPSRPSNKPQRVPSGVQAWLTMMEDDGLHDETYHAIHAARSASFRTVDDLSPSGKWQVASEPVPECVQEWLDEMQGESDEEDMDVEEYGEEEEEEEEQDSAVVAAARSGGIGAAIAASRRESSRRALSTNNKSSKLLAIDEADEEAAAAGDMGEYGMEMERWETSVRKFERRMNALRVVFLLCGVGLITASALFYSKGLMSLKTSLEDAQGTISYGEEVLTSAHDLTVGYLKSREIVQAEAENMRLSSDEFCPLTSSALERLNLTAEETASIEDVMGNVKDALGSVGSVLEEQFTDMERDLATAIESAESANDALDYAYPFLYAGAAVMGVQILITVALMVEVVLAWRGKKMRNCFVRCMKNGIILPIFFVFLLLGWLFASLFLLAAISGADFCADPDANVETLLKSVVDSGQYSSSLIDYFKYFVGCNDEVKPEKIPDEATLVFDAISVLHNFTEYLSSDGSIATSVCGGAGANLLQSLASIVHVELHVINSIFIGLLNILQCSTFNPMYVGAMYDAMCINGVDGLTWMFSCQLAIAVCSMIMITIRASRQEVVVEGDGEDYYPVSEESTKQLAVDPANGEDEGTDPQMAAAAAATAGAGGVAAGAAYIFPCEESSSDGGTEREMGGEPAASEGDASLGVESLEEDEAALALDSEELAYYAVLETLTPAQQDAVEAIGAVQDQAGVMMSEKECVDHLKEVRPELSDEQINAVIALELLSRNDRTGEAHDEENSLAAARDTSQAADADEENILAATRDAPQAADADEENSLAAARSSPQAAEDHEAHLDVLESLTDAQREYIEEIGVAQESGEEMSEEEISDALQHVPGISEEQIKAVIALEMSSRESQ